MAFEDYVHSEVVADYAEGFITRREALRRLMLLGVGATAAGTLLAACGGGPSSPTGAAGGATPPVGPAPLATEPVTFAGPAGPLQGSWSAAPDPKGGV